MEELAARVTAVQERIHRAAHQAGRQPAEITLVAVTKTWPLAVLLAAYEAGLRHFGENRAEELAQKRPALEAQLGADTGITWHHIGTLQSRKTTFVADQADVFHALDRLKIANRLSTRLGENGRHLSVFLEINISGEESKSGFNMSNWETDATQINTLRSVAQQVMDLPGLTAVGLMTMAPWGAPATAIQTVFRRTRHLARRLQEELRLDQPLQLSMGMTDDFELAIAEGATHIRVGRAIFGERQRH